MILPEVKSKIGEDISIVIYLDNCKWNYIVDCGEASMLSVKDCMNTRAIFISHTHIDHFINFDQIMRHQVGCKERIVICGPKNIALQVQAKLRSFTWNLVEEDAILYEIREIISENKIKVYEMKPAQWELTPLEDRDSLYQDERLLVNYTILDHKTDVIAYHFKDNDKINIAISETSYKPGKWINELKNAYINKDRNCEIEIDQVKYSAQSLFYLLQVEKGNTLGVILDHAAHEENHNKIRNLFNDCDTVLIETFYKDEDKEKAILNFHSYASQSGEVMRKSNVKKAVPIHFSRKYIEEEIAQIEIEFYKAFERK
ncbi:peptidase [Flavobacterium sediminilitoris]|uniref:Peptidase n=1 Tax=Flavobacterium sediminilitoris TaxID=2024526 RepID=A0ABY4HPB8_9FLAO|nr:MULTISPECIES: peptidase [Flavobacterium]UOX33369.1 peptidase [Flavobacterium sediminilitoris]